MGCGCGGEETKEGILVEAKSASTEAIEKFIKKDKNGEWAFAIYDDWYVSGDPVEIETADGQKRMSWPKPWKEIEELLEANGLGKIKGHVKDETVGLDSLPHITDECVTWPCLQNLFRRCWVGVNGEWVKEEHEGDDDPYRGLLRKLTLKVKVEGFTKMVMDMGEDKIRDELWEIYIAWPVDSEPTTVSRYNRKKKLQGINEDTEKATWPLPFEGETSITSLMTACGWNGDNISALKTSLFDLKDETGVHPNCCDSQVCWPDIQQVFRSTVSEEAWTKEDNEAWPPLDGRKVTLRLKVHEEKIKDILEGEYRMYCKPDGGEAFSYGLIVENVDLEACTFEGRSRTEGRYDVANGKFHFDKRTGRLNISYDECWPGQVDSLSARVKSNAKFQCESADGFEQKATNESKNLPDDPDDRIGENAQDGVKKYYQYDQDAAAD